MQSGETLHLKPRPFGSSRICPLTASKIHQTDFADLQQKNQQINCNIFTDNKKAAAIDLIWGAVSLKKQQLYSVIFSLQYDLQAIIDFQFTTRFKSGSSISS